MIIALSGKKQSGKNTIGDVLSTRHGYIQESFAGCLKEVCSDLFNIPLKDLFGTDDDKNKLSSVRWDGFSCELNFIREKYWDGYSTYLSIRNVLQIFGTDIGRNFYENIWVNKMKSKLDIHVSNGLNVVVVDGRFPNEMIAIEEYGGHAVRLLRNKDSTDTHPSETALDDWKFEKIIDNRNMTPDEQYKSLCLLVGLNSIE